MSKEPKSAIWHSNYFKRNIDGDTLCILSSTSTPERQQKRKFAEGPPFSDFFKARLCPSNVVTEQEQNLARLVARPTTPISIVESDEFIKFVENYDSRQFLGNGRSANSPFK
uniref:Uncharacterized protein n=1 Tax=Globodera rostochiensis TaxID=31243 RepID=A0A914H379_GLORO